MARLESEAQAKAAKHVANMLARPDQLEKVGQLAWRVSRKKASVEAMLKTAMQSQVWWCTMVVIMVVVVVEVVMVVVMVEVGVGVIMVEVVLVDYLDPCSQLDGVRTGLNQLEKALQDMAEIRWLVVAGLLLVK